jgi:hypothetical protein
MDGRTSFRPGSMVVDVVPIPEQETGNLVIGEGVGDLLGGPLGIGMFGHVEVNELPPVMAEDDEDIEDAEGGGGDGEEVAGSDVGDVVGQKGPPGLGRRLLGTHHVLGHGPLGDLVAQQQEFGEDSWRTGIAHQSDSTRQAPGSKRRNSLWWNENGIIARHRSMSEILPVLRVV